MPRPTGADVGSVMEYFEGGHKYIQYLKQTVEEDFTGIHVALDCAHGATSTLATHVFADLDADLSTMGASPNGLILMTASVRHILKNLLNLSLKKKRISDWHLTEMGIVLSLLTRMVRLSMAIKLCTLLARHFIRKAV